MVDALAALLAIPLRERFEDVREQLFAKKMSARKRPR